MPFPVSVSVPAAAGPRPLGLNEHIYLPIYLPPFLQTVFGVHQYLPNIRPSVLAIGLAVQPHTRRSPSSKIKPNKTSQALAALLALRILWMRSPSGCGCLMNDT